MAWGNSNTCIIEERLTLLVKKIYTEKLEKQQQISLMFFNPFSTKESFADSDNK